MNRCYELMNEGLKLLCSEEEKLWTAVIDWNAIQEIQEVEPIVFQLPVIQDTLHMFGKKSANGAPITEIKINAMRESP